MPIKGWIIPKRRYIFNYVVVICLTFLMLCFYLATRIKPIGSFGNLKPLINVDFQAVETNFSLKYYNKPNNKSYASFVPYKNFSNQNGSFSGSKYLVDSSKCKIINLDPFNPEILAFQEPDRYISCEERGLLTYVKKKDNVATLHIDQQRVKEYTNGSIHCCYSVITRKDVAENRRPVERTIYVSTCRFFSNNVTMPSNFILVICKDNKTREVYRNVHASIKIKKKVQKKMKLFDIKRKKHLSVLFIGIDSVSRMHLIRSLPTTHLFLKENGWLEFKGYNKVGDNTYPNLMALLTGLNQTMALKVCNPRKSLDRCKMIWYSYGDLGYTTAYAEDEIDIGTFNNLKKGFKNEPTDYYFRPYIIATEKYLRGLRIDSTWFCTGPEIAGERIFNLARDFITTFKQYPNFGFFWMNSYSHNNARSISKMDEKILSFFKDLTKHNILENSIVVFLSDHGFRYGPILYTNGGWIESRLPFLYVWIPKWFRKQYPNEYKNLAVNTERLTSPYDLYMTLQDILILSEKNYTVQKSSGCPKCKSLFEEVDIERSCVDAGIERHWCACYSYANYDEGSLIATRAAEFIINEIRKLHKAFDRLYAPCTHFVLEKVLNITISNNSYTLYENMSFLLVTLQTFPEAVFKATLSVNLTMYFPIFKLEGDITRIDEYRATSRCVRDSFLKKYCYCALQYVQNQFMHPV